ncbi:MAG: hypothetical protein K2N64_06130 [Anaeroplasmataceae bacterium]|nr:hypothetical protein [Anaeroplasmataceae bacterium]
MKKVLLSVCLFLGLVTLSSCNEESVNITYTDSLGNEKTIAVEATEDQEVVQGVLDYANQATYESVDEVSIQSGVSLSAVLNDDFVSLFPNLGGNTIQASAIANFDLNMKEGMSFSLAADASIGNQNSAMYKLNAYYDGALDSLTTINQNAYVDLSYGLKSSSGEDISFSLKKAILVEDIFDSIEDEIDISQIPDFDSESISIEEFKNLFPNSKIVISEVQKGVIRIKLSVTILDIVNLIKEVGSNSEINEILAVIQSIYDYTDLKKTIDFTFAIEAKTGRMCGYSVKLDDPDLLNLFLLYFQSEGLLPGIVTNLASVFNFEFELSISYENVKVKKLSSSEKEQYKLNE